MLQRAIVETDLLRQSHVGKADWHRFSLLFHHHCHKEIQVGVSDPQQAAQKQFELCYDMEGIETVRTDESYWDTIVEPLQSVVSGPWTKNQAGNESGA